jgi:hypothetical protein
MPKGTNQPDGTPDTSFFYLGPFLMQMATAPKIPNPAFPANQAASHTLFLI